jgi:hypothetical protein
MFKKGSIRWHLKGFSDVRESFLPGIFNKQNREICTGGYNNGTLGNPQIDRSVGFSIINSTQ